MKCEVCGASDASKVAEVEGSEMRVCEECSSLGTVKSKSPSKKRKPKKKSKTPKKFLESSRSSEEEVLKKNYGKVVRKAREEADLTMEDLAKKLSEKESVIRRVENKELKPDETLSEKLERELDVELFEELDIEVENFRSEDEELTIGDVAELK
ncbi:MAG: multiprotein bridging factor aMBF1 [Candidatus Aenigmatarchaeota archaeon]